MKPYAEDLLPFALAEVARVGCFNREHVREGRIKVGDRVFLIGTDTNCRSMALDYTWGRTNQAYDNDPSYSYRVIARFDQED